MKQVLIKRGEVLIEDVPAPQVQAGTILVKVVSSCISPGTEGASIARSSELLWRRALQKPDKARAALDLLVRDGWDKFQIALESKFQGVPTGYSAAGIVHEIGPGVDEFSVGDRVACAGAQCAFHAEWICVPSNLATRLPEATSFEVGSTVALGSIALQGIRRASPTLGETFVVFGLGAIGQITVQLLKANGCRVIATDLTPDRGRLATELGADFVITAGEQVPIEVRQLTAGEGADGAIVTASSSSNSVISEAFQVCRKKGRVVLVGDVGLSLERADLYEKELDFLISTSYGPGRYDSHYENDGLDYPIGYVRWTENRNMAEYLRLSAERKLQVEPLITHRAPVTHADKAYDELRNHKSHMLAVLDFEGLSSAPERKLANTTSTTSRGKQGRIRVAMLGAGEFARGTHLPNLHALRDSFEIYAIVSRTGHIASQVATQFGAKFSATDYESVLSDPRIDAVIIATRHNLHADLALKCLAAGKHVLVEKPLALTRSQLRSISRFFEESVSDPPILLTGFNRRHSEYASDIFDLISKRHGPMVINYTMNAGHLPKDHWVQGQEGGGRNLGEACHIYDLFTFLTGTQVLKVQAVATRPETAYSQPRDNFVAAFNFADGSIASLTYASTGSSAYPKETMRVFFDGKTIVLDDYRHLSGYGVRLKERRSRVAEKGHLKELKCFAAAIRGERSWPIPLWQQLQATEMALDIEDILSGGQAVKLSPSAAQTELNDSQEHQEP